MASRLAKPPAVPALPADVRVAPQLLPPYAHPRPNEAGQPLTRPDPGTAAPATTQSLARLQAQRNAVPAAAVEKEFIYNLQQQVYFLELQGRLLRERLTEAGPRLKSRAVEANPLLDRSLDEAAPLSEFMEGLKLKYVELEKKYRETISGLEGERATLQARVRDLEAEASVLTRRLEDRPAELARLAGRYDQRLLAQQAALEHERKTVEALTFDVHARADELASVQALLDARNAEVAAGGAERLRLGNALKEAQGHFLSPARAEERERAVAELAVAVGDVKTQLKYAQEELLTSRASEKTATDLRWRLEQDLERARADRAEAQAQAAALREDAKAGHASLTAARRRVEELEILEKRWRTKHDDIVESSTTLLQDAKVQSEVAQRRVGDAVAARRAAEDACAQAAKDRDYYQRTSATLTERVALLEAGEQRLKDELAAVNQDSAEKVAAARQGELRSQVQQERIAELEEQTQDLQREVEKCYKELDLMDSELQMKNGLSAMRLEEFEQLRATNEELAATIANLTRRFSKLGHNARDYEQSGYTIRKDHALARTAAECVVEGDLASPSGRQRPDFARPTAGAPATATAATAAAAGQREGTVTSAQEGPVREAPSQASARGTLERRALGPAPDATATTTAVPRAAQPVPAKDKAQLKGKRPQTAVTAKGMPPTVDVKRQTFEPADLDGVSFDDFLGN